MKINLIDFGKETAKMRDFLGMTRKSLSEESGINLSSILKLENGTHVAGTDRACRILSAFSERLGAKGIALEVDFWTTTKEK